MSDSKPRPVVAGVIERDGQILVCQRKAGSWHAGEWEFPGGKTEPGEEPSAALARELREELGIEAVIGEELDRYEYQYAGRTPILLIFFRVREFAGEPKNLEFERIEWTVRERLSQYSFLAGDTAFLRRYQAG